MARKDIKKEASSVLNIKGAPAKVKVPKEKKRKTPWYLVTTNDELCEIVKEYFSKKKSLLSEDEQTTVVPSNLEDKIDAALKRMQILAGKA